MADDNPGQKQVEKLTRSRRQEIDPYKLRLSFPPATQKRLEQMLELVEKQGNPGNPDIQQLKSNLRELRSDDIRLVRAVQLIAKMSEEIHVYGEHFRNSTLPLSWDIFVSDLERLGPHSYKPFTLKHDNEKGRGLGQ